MFANPAVTFIYEPGSTFKLITMAGALNERVVTPQTTFVDNGAFPIGGYVIRNWDGKANGPSNMVTLLEKSSNIGATWVAFQSGKERFYHYVNLFGFGQATGIDLQGEATGIVKAPGAPGWGEVDLATNSFGQAISVSPMQMVSAVAAIANGGIMMRPHVVKDVRDPGTGRVVRQTERQIVRQVITRETASALLQMMVNAAENEGVRGAARPRLLRGREDRHRLHPRRRGLRPHPDHRLLRGRRPGQGPPVRRPGQDRPPPGRALGLPDRQAGLRPGGPGAGALPQGAGRVPRHHRPGRPPRPHPSPPPPAGRRRRLPRPPGDAPTGRPGAGPAGAGRRRDRARGPRR